MFDILTDPKHNTIFITLPLQQTFLCIVAVLIVLFIIALLPPDKKKE